MKSKFVIMGMFAWLLAACQQSEPTTVMDLFKTSKSLVQQESGISEEHLARVEGLTCDGENLIVYDLHSGQSYSLFHLNTGAYITRFGNIGQGPDEIPAGCFGYLNKGSFTVFNNQTKEIKQYCLGALNGQHEVERPVRLARYDIPGFYVSRLIAINDSTFLGAGCYQSAHQFVCFNKNGDVIDSGIDVYNKSNQAFNDANRSLANQGDLVMQPSGNVFAYSLNFSSNLDIIKMSDGKISSVKSLRMGDPVYKPAVGGGGAFSSADPTQETIIGYIGLSATENYIYALYSDKKLYEQGSRKSATVLQFDWQGNAVCKFTLDTEAYFITVDAADQNLYAAVKDESGGWKIVVYHVGN